MSFTVNDDQNFDLINYPFHFYRKNTPRFVVQDHFSRLMSDQYHKNLPKPASVNDVLLIYRKLKYYTDLEKIHEYEISNAYAYELAMRTQNIKEYIRQTPLRNNLNETWIDLEMAIIFERRRYLQQERFKTKNWTEYKQWSNRPNITVPEVVVPVNETEYMDIHLNMSLPKKELIAYLETYIKNIADTKKKKRESPANFETIIKLVSSNIKLFKKIGNIPEMFASNIRHVIKPSTITLKLAESFFSYDMVEMGFKYDDIAKVIKKYRAFALYELNKNNSSVKDIDEYDYFSCLLSDVEPGKTIDVWHNTLQNIVKEGAYKYVVAPKQISYSLRQKKYLSMGPRKKSSKL